MIDEHKAWQCKHCKAIEVTDTEPLSTPESRLELCAQRESGDSWGHDWQPIRVRVLETTAAEGD